MIIGALEAMLSKEHMRTVLNRFVKHYKYDAYSSADFEFEMIRYFESIGGDRSIMKSFITSWTHLPGLPFVEAIPEPNLRSITLSQVVYLPFFHVESI